MYLNVAIFVARHNVLPTELPPFERLLLQAPANLYLSATQGFII
jgi:hypothetical protein